MSSQVKVHEGILQGKQCETYFGKKYYSFEGIPYAKPPVGKLRFKAPEELEGWTGIRDATQPGNQCYQLNPYINTPKGGSEDCLFLNIYTPSLPQEEIQKLPVMFFVHGGRLIYGYGHYYKPDYLLKNDVILVTVNYRLHALGFLCLNIPEVPGNAGLKDIIMALRWVKKNISFFNGDPNNVTVVGESVGSAIVGSFLTSKMTDGLFHKVICQSGAPNGDLYMVEENTIEKAKIIASNLGRNLLDERSLYEFFVNVPIKDLVIAFNKAELSRPPSIINAFMVPVIEKEFDGVERFYAEYPRIDITMNRFKKIPILIGMTSHEGAFFVQKDGEGCNIYEKDFYYFIPRYIKLQQNDERAFEIKRKLLQFYFNNRKVNDKTVAEYVDLVSDSYLSFDIVHAIESIAKFNSEAYFYKFSYSGGMNTGTMKSLGMKGANHGDMMQYQFYRKSKHSKCTDKDDKIVDILSEAWCNFARNGTPSWKDKKTKWLPYTPTDKHTLLIDDDLQLVRNPDIHRYKFWQSLIGETSKL